MDFDNTVKLSFVMFAKHVNLGGESSKSLHSHGQLVHLDLLFNGMVRVSKPNGVFYVAATHIESCEAAPAPENAESAEPGPEKAEILKESAAKATKSRKSTDSDAHLSRADEILRELVR